MSCAPLFHISAVSGQEAVPFCAEGQRQPVSSPVNPAVNAASRAEQQKSRAHRLSRQQMKNRVEGAWQTNRQPSRFAAVVASLGCTPLLSCAVWLCVYCIWFQCSCTFFLCGNQSQLTAFQAVVDQLLCIMMIIAKHYKKEGKSVAFRPFTLCLD